MNGTRGGKASRYGEDWDSVPSADPFAKDRATLRLGAVSELGTQSLVRGLAQQAGVSLEVQPPGPLAAGIETGSLDCALLPLLDCVRLPLCRVIPGIGLCSHGVTRTEMLFAAKDPASMQRVATYPHWGSADSVARIILGDVFNVTPEFVPVALGTFAPEAFDGLVVSGDGAWTCPNPYSAVFDLGALWHDLTGLPLVRMMWAARFGAPFPRLRSLLSQALQRGLAELDAIIAEVAGNGTINADAAAKYFAETVYYTVGGREMEGAAEFLRRAAKYGLCAPDATIELC